MKLILKLDYIFAKALDLKISYSALMKTMYGKK